jgi:REP element-mobilizing transposase RayT
VDRQFLFGGTEKEHLVKLMKRYADFCGVRMLTYCVMSNHFHVLVEVPKRPDNPAEVVTDEQIGSWGRTEIGSWGRTVP